MLRCVARMSLSKLLPDAIFRVLLRVLLVEGNDVDNCLGVTFLLLLGNTSAGQNVLPFTRETLRELVDWPIL